VLGLILSIAATGGILGGLLSQRLLRRLRLGHVYAAALAVGFVPSLLLPAAGGPAWLQDTLFTVTWFLGYLGISVVNIVIMSLRQTVTPPSMLGRMNAAARAVMFGLGAIGGPLAGLIAAQSSVRGSLWVSTAASAVFVFGGVLFSPVSRLRTMPPRAADAADAVDITDTKDTVDTARTTDDR
jgi:MFS family permease